MIAARSRSCSRFRRRVVRFSSRLGDNARYDLVVDDGRCLLRVQCTTGRLRDGGVRFNACSNRGRSTPSAPARRDYSGEIDVFAVYCYETAGVYLIPIGDLSAKAEGALRIEPTRNGQATGIRFAAGY